jgi:hypothetical protein
MNPSLRKALYGTGFAVVLAVAMPPESLFLAAPPIVP